MGGRRCGYGDNIRIQSHAISRKVGKAIASAIWMEVVDSYRVSIDMAEFAQLMKKHLKARRWALHATRIERKEAEARNFLSLLRTSSNRPRGYAADICEELAPSHLLP